MLDYRESEGISEKNIYLCLVNYAKAFDCVDHDKLWKDIKDGNTRLSYLSPEKPYAGQESAVRTLYETTDWFKIKKGAWQGCLLSPCLFNLYSEYIRRNAGLDDLQAEIKIGGRNINNFRYVDDTTLMAESEEELKNLFLRMKENEKAGLKH